MPKDIYGPEDLVGFDYTRDLGEQGKFPFTRGVYPTMYLKVGGKPFTIRQFSGHGTAEDTNKRFKFELSKGVTGLSTAVDLPTLMGHDADNPLCRGHVGYDGVAITSIKDMEELFDGIPLNKITTSMTINAPAAVIWAMYLANAQRQGYQLEGLGGTIQNDILKEYLAQKEWIVPVVAGVRLVVDTIEFAAKYVKKWHPVSISGYHIREAGATAQQEVAYTLADGLTYVKETMKRGIVLDEFAPQLSFFFDVQFDDWYDDFGFLAEVAKFRAARRLWARLMKEFGAKNEKSMWLKFHAQTAGVSLVSQEPLNNLTRVAFQAFAAALGGAQSIHANSYDEVYCTPTKEAVERAIRTLQIIIEETGLRNIIDPLGGSYALESLTNRIEEEAYEEIKKIDNNFGGMIGAIEAGYPQQMIRTSALEFQSRLESGQVAKVGLNRYQNFSEDPQQKEVLNQIFQELQERQRGTEEAQVRKVMEFKAGRQNDLLMSSFDELKRQLADPKVNLMPPFIEAVKAGATVGEICQILKETFGEYKEKESPGAVTSPRLKEEFSRIFSQYKFKKPLRVLIAKAGLDGHDRGIHNLINLFRGMGAEVIYSGLHRSIPEVARIALQEDVDAVGLSALIGSPIVFFSQLKKDLRDLGRSKVILFGGGTIRPYEKEYLETNLGIKRVFPFETAWSEIAEFITEVSSSGRR